MHPHIPPVSRVTLFKGGLNLQRGSHPTKFVIFSQNY